MIFCTVSLSCFGSNGSTIDFGAVPDDYIYIVVVKHVKHLLRPVHHVFHLWLLLKLDHYYV